MDVELPLASGAGHWIWLGGRPALDLVNTRRERWRRDIDTLVLPSDLGDWLEAAGFDLAGASTDGGALDAARRLRDSIDAALDAVLEARRPPRDALATIDAWIPSAQVTPHLVQRGKAAVLAEPRPRDPVAHALGVVALDAARMLGTDERERVRICASATCGVRFYDRSPAGRRRWCSMERCGNVAKARRHRRRGSS